MLPGSFGAFEAEMHYGKICEAHWRYEEFISDDAIQSTLVKCRSTSDYEIMGILYVYVVFLKPNLLRKLWILLYTKAHFNGAIHRVLKWIQGDSGLYFALFFWRHRSNGLPVAKKKTTTKNKIKKNKKKTNKKQQN